MSKVAFATWDSYVFDSSMAAAPTENMGRVQNQ
jgi:hypothetical protein